MAKLTKTFNPHPATIMHLDINSCFATIEQQANPFLRGKKIAVAVYTGPSGRIIAPSIEAKKGGVKTGMRVKDGRRLCPELIVLPPDPWKYRAVHRQLKTLLATYTDRLVPKSIDEFVLDFKDCPSFNRGLRTVAQEIKQRIKKEVGEWIRVSIGLGPNRFCAKTASSLRKPDGLEEINKDNYLEVYARLNLEDLHGIASKNAARLQKAGITTVLGFAEADLSTLKKVFRSVNAYYWYRRLRGWEVDDARPKRHSFSNSYALPKPLTPKELSPILTKLVEKTGRRMRQEGYRARGVQVTLNYRDGTRWHKRRKVKAPLFDSRDIYREAYRLLREAPCQKPVAILAEALFDLAPAGLSQGELFENTAKRERLVVALDKLSERWGEYVVSPARMLGTEESVPDRIAFGR